MLAQLGRYELVRRLGRGGMAEVFLARHRGPGGYEKRLVIKRILPHLAADPRFLRLFFEEARLHVSLTHGNLVPIFDFGRVGNTYFLAMEYVEGRDLSALVASEAKQGTRLSPGCAVLLGQELCRALSHVHRHGLVHRDVTPRNVLVSVDGEVKLADFGVVQRGGDHEAGVRGTIAYMAPEQARGAPVDLRADLYSLGLVLAEVVLGRPVREDVGDAEAQLRVACAASRVELEGPFASLIARATEPDPANRYPDAVSMAADLDRIERELGGSRAESVAMLGERARAAASPVVDESAEARGLEDGPATYYRDGGTEVSIIDAIVEPTVEPRRGGGRPMVLGILGVLVVSAGAAVALSRPSRPTSLIADASVPVASASVRTEQPDLAPMIEPVAVTPGVKVAHAPVRVAPIIAAKKTPVQASVGAVRVQCLPWCTVDVDGHREGEGGLVHQLPLPVGRHQLVMRRIDDTEQRTVDVTPGSSAEVSVHFE